MTIDWPFELILLKNKIDQISQSNINISTSIDSLGQSMTNLDETLNELIEVLRPKQIITHVIKEDNQELPEYYD